MDESETSSLSHALAPILLPLARMMIDGGMTLPEAVELLKSALVQAAGDAAPDGSNSQLSLVTGVHRKDIKRLRDNRPKPRSISAMARVMSLWQNDPDFLTLAGSPRPLGRHSGSDGPGFDDLVRRTKIDAAPATVLQILEEAGNVHVEGEEIELRSSAFVPSDYDARLSAFVATLEPHLQVATGNLAGDPPQFDQAVRYSHLTDASAQTLRHEAAELAQALLQHLDRRAHELQSADDGKDDAQSFFATGVFTQTKGPTKT